MSETPTLESSSRRLAAALDALEAAVSRRTDADRRAVALTTQMQALGEDRIRLAESLDSERARSIRLETANRDVSRRLTAAMNTVRTVIDAQEDEQETGFGQEI